MTDARSMSAAEWREARANAMRGVSAVGSSSVMGELRSRHPDLARAADAQTWTNYRVMLRELVRAELAMHAAAEAEKTARAQPSQLTRLRAEERLEQAVSAHDALQMQVEAAHAALPPEQESTR